MLRKIKNELEGTDIQKFLRRDYFIIFVRICFLLVEVSSRFWNCLNVLKTRLSIYVSYIGNGCYEVSTVKREGNLNKND